MVDESLKQKLVKLNPEILAEFLEKEAEINPELTESVGRLADYNSPDKVLDSIITEIKAIRRAREFIDWRGSSRFSQTLARIIYNIETLVLPTFPEKALKALNSFFEISQNVMERTDDSSGNVSGEFRYAVTVWGKAWNSLPKINSNKLVNEIWNYFDNNDYGLYDDMITAAGDALKRDGIDELEALVKSQLLNGKSRFSLQHALHDIALLRQSPEDFIEVFKLTKQEMHVPDQLELAKLYMDTSRVEEAIHLLESIHSDYDAHRRLDLLIEAYGMQHKTDTVQQLRWDGFVKQRRKNLFKSYYDELPSEQEKKDAINTAIDVALTWNTMDSIAMLFELNHHDKAAELLHRRYASLTGHQYYTLKDFAEEFTKSGFPLEAILIYRRLTEDILARAQSKYYHHAINYLQASKQISTYVQDWKNYQTTFSYFNQLKDQHSRKPSFMQKFALI